MAGALHFSYARSVSALCYARPRLSRHDAQFVGSVRVTRETPAWEDIRVGTRTGHRTPAEGRQAEGAGGGDGAARVLGSSVTVRCEGQVKRARAKGGSKVVREGIKNWGRRQNGQGGMARKK